MKKRNALSAILVLLSASCYANAEQNFVVYTTSPNTLPSTDEAKISPIGSRAYQVKFNDERHAQPWVSQWDVQGVQYEREEALQFVRNEADSPFADNTQAVRADASVKWNDPLLSSQSDWVLPLNNIQGGLALQRTTSPVNVAVLDVGYLSHEDLLPISGYSLTTYGSLAVSDDYRASSTNAGKTCTSAHGNNMMGIIGATRDNGKGIAGISSANIYAGRVLATDCTNNTDVGLLSDVANGIYWAIGNYKDHKIPKADFVNISVAAQSHCPAVLQEAIDTANKAGTVVVVSAGNYGDLADKYAPANCQGVVVVGAHDGSGSLTNYSNFGDRLTMTVGGARFTVSDTGYSTVNGTSGAAAAVTGMLASLKQSFPKESNHKIVELLKSSVTNNADSCKFNCGAGYANLSNAMVRGERLFDPQLSLSHAFSSGDCLQDRQVDGLKSYFNACQAYTASINTNYAEDKESPAIYKVKLIRREVSESQWVDGRFETISSVYPSINKAKSPWLDIDPVKYEYGMVACDGDYCPYPVDIDISKIPKPVSCK